jgi:ubiquinone/menaquinone biosynthesis C-methylase UbiE
MNAELKSCCAAAYQSEFARMLLGESFHPGGLELTERLGKLLTLTPGDSLLDVASGRGESAILLARRFGCRVLGIDFGAGNISDARARAEAAGVANLVQFEVGDSERLNFREAQFDAIICECAFCTFPDKRAAAGEFARVLRPGGRVGLSDLTRSGPLPPELNGLFAWIACIADARPASEYVAYLEAAGFQPISIDTHDDALRAMIRDIQGRLLAAELMVSLEKMALTGVNFHEAKVMARSAAEAVRAGLLGYSLITARKGASW